MENPCGRVTTAPWLYWRPIHDPNVALVSHLGFKEFDFHAFFALLKSIATGLPPGPTSRTKSMMLTVAICTLNRARLLDAILQNMLGWKFRRTLTGNCQWSSTTAPKIPK